MRGCLESLPSEELVRRGRAGDEKCFNVLILRLEPFWKQWIPRVIVGRPWETLDDQLNRFREVLWIVMKSPQYFNSSRKVKFETLAWKVLEVELFNNNRVQMRCRERAKRNSYLSGDEEEDLLLEVQVILTHPPSPDFEVRKREFYSSLTGEETLVVEALEVSGDSRRKIRGRYGFRKKELKTIIRSAREKFLQMV